MDKSDENGDTVYQSVVYLNTLGRGLIRLKARRGETDQELEQRARRLMQLSRGPSLLDLDGEWIATADGAQCTSDVHATRSGGWDRLHLGSSPSLLVEVDSHDSDSPAVSGHGLDGGSPSAPTSTPTRPHDPLPLF